VPSDVRIERGLTVIDSVETRSSVQKMVFGCNYFHSIRKSAFIHYANRRLRGTASCIPPIKELLSLSIEEYNILIIMYLWEYMLLQMQEKIPKNINFL